MIPKKFRKKPIIIKAIQWTGHNTKECMEFVDFNNIIAFPFYFEIKTLEGNMIVNKGDWIIKGVKGDEK